MNAAGVSPRLGERVTVADCGCRWVERRVPGTCSRLPDWEAPPAFMPGCAVGRALARGANRARVGESVLRGGKVRRGVAETMAAGERAAAGWMAAARAHCEGGSDG